MEKRKCIGFGVKYLIQNIVLFVPLAVFFFLAWQNFEKLNTVFWVSTVLFIFGVVSGLIWDKHRIKKFYCPQCKMHITEPTIINRKEGDPLNYVCKKCDIEWETGLREGGSEA